jgi:hypothetical protein
MSESPSIKAVGFTFFSPEVFLLFADHDRDHVHFYPPATGGQTLRLPKSKRRHVVLITSLDKLHLLAKQADALYRVVVFADSGDLQELGIPLLDASVDEDGKVVPCHRQNRTELLSRVDKEAVAIEVDKPISAVKRARRKAKETAAYAGPTFKQLLREIKTHLAAEEGFDFGQEIGVPAVLRLMNDTVREEFKGSCRNMIKRGGVDDKVVKKFYKWVEGIEGGVGPELGKAVDALLYPDDEDDPPTASVIAERHGVNVFDLNFVADVYQKLQNMDEEDEDEE